MVVSLSCTSSDSKCLMAFGHIKLNELFLNNYNLQYLKNSLSEETVDNYISYGGAGSSVPLVKLIARSEMRRLICKIPNWLSCYNFLHCSGKIGIQKKQSKANA